MAEWQPKTTVPTDGRLFNFRCRNLATWEVMPPLVGRYHQDNLEWNNFGKWEQVGFPLVMWCEIPELP
jgi:hypothetical protein